MQNLLRRRGARWLLAGGLALTLSLVGLAALRGQPDAASGVAAARARWAGRPFDAYTLTLNQQSRAGVCDQQIVTQGEEARQSLRNTCGQPPNWTVTRLLNWIVELERTPTRCYPSSDNCACQVTATTQVTYDGDLGFPRQIVYEWRSQPNLINPAFWRIQFDRTFPGCSNIQASGTGGALTVNVRLVPAP